MRYQDLQSGVELNEDLTPKQYSIGLLLEYTVPWVSGLTAFCCGVSLILYLFEVWRYSPLFYIVGFVTSIVLTVVIVIIGLIVVLFSGSFFVFKNIPDLYSITSYQIFTSLIVASVSMLYIRRFFSRIQISEESGFLTLGICLAITVCLFTIPEPNYIVGWFRNIVDLIGKLVSAS